ncbi:MAG: hypothetical protein FD123_1109 [Bacteroidetes bacterium]|nr:MAG: hypothetical protein FD123_1109 [Bacteroidota bacterium]
MTRLSSVPAFRPLLLIIIGILLLAFAGSCRKDNSLFGIRGSGNAVNETRATGIFNGVSLSIDADVVLHTDSNCRVVITAQQNILDVLETGLHGTELAIGFRENVRSHSNITIHVYAPVYVLATISGSGSVSNADSIHTTDFETKISGSGNITINYLDCSTAKASISGSGNITLSGQCQSAKYTISGSGSIRGFGLTGLHGDVNISGSGDTEINVTQTLNIRISGSGNVYYKNTPAIQVSTSGSGNVTHVN